METQPLQRADQYGYEGEQLDAYRSQSSPDVILEIMLKNFKVGTSLDVGCGIGLWSKVLSSKGVDAIGVDGKWVPLENLLIAKDKFLVKDITQPFDLEKKFDLVLCLEVAEHVLTAQSDSLLKNLTKHSDLVLFSAAVPGQGGFEHINEQWQSFWVNKFKNFGYTGFDFIRPKVFGNEKVRFYYQQNVILFANEAAISKYESVLGKGDQSAAWDIIHRDLYDRWRNPENVSLVQVFKKMPIILARYGKSFLVRMGLKK